MIPASVLQEERVENMSSLPETSYSMLDMLRNMFGDSNPDVQARKTIYEATQATKATLDAANKAAKARMKAEEASNRARAHAESTAQTHAAAALQALRGAEQKRLDELAKTRRLMQAYGEGNISNLSAGMYPNLSAGMYPHLVPGAYPTGAFPGTPYPGAYPMGAPPHGPPNASSPPGWVKAGQQPVPGGHMVYYVQPPTGFLHRAMTGDASRGQSQQYATFVPDAGPHSSSSSSEGSLHTGPLQQAFAPWHSPWGAPPPYWAPGGQYPPYGGHPAPSYGMQHWAPPPYGGTPYKQSFPPPWAPHSSTLQDSYLRPQEVSKPASPPPTPKPLILTNDELCETNLGCLVSRYTDAFGAQHYQDHRSLEWWWNIGGNWRPNGSGQVPRLVHDNAGREVSYGPHTTLTPIATKVAAALPKPLDESQALEYDGKTYIEHKGSWWLKLTEGKYAFCGQGSIPTRWKIGEKYFDYNPEFRCLVAEGGSCDARQTETWYNEVAHWVALHSAKQWTQAPATWKLPALAVGLRGCLYLVFTDTANNHYRDSVSLRWWIKIDKAYTPNGKADWPQKINLKGVVATWDPKAHAYRTPDNTYVAPDINKFKVDMKVEASLPTGKKFMAIPDGDGNALRDNEGYWWIQNSDTDTAVFAGSGEAPQLLQHNRRVYIRAKDGQVTAEDEHDVGAEHVSVFGAQYSEPLAEVLVINTDVFYDLKKDILYNFSRTSKITHEAKTDPFWQDFLSKVIAQAQEYTKIPLLEGAIAEEKSCDKEHHFRVGSYWWKLSDSTYHFNGAFSEPYQVTYCGRWQNETAGIFRDQWKGNCVEPRQATWDTRTRKYISDDSSAAPIRWSTILETPVEKPRVAMARFKLKDARDSKDSEAIQAATAELTAAINEKSTTPSGGAGSGSDASTPSTP